MTRKPSLLAPLSLLALGMAAAAVAAVAVDQPATAASFEAHAVADAAQWHRLDASAWIVDGRDGARVVYVFTDPNCPYCNKLWADARPWVAAGKVQLRHVIVGILTPTSPGKAAALLTADDPAVLFAAYEGRNAGATAAALASGQVRPMADAALQPVDHIAPAQQAQLAANLKLMASLRLQATPGLVWRDGQGVLHARQGQPEGGLASILGPR